MAKRVDVSNEVLDDTVVVSPRFFGAISQNPGIRAVLETRGYTEEVHQGNWQLVFTAHGYRPPKPGPAPNLAVKAALAELNAWDNLNFPIARTSLEDDFPEQDHYLFAGLEPKENPHESLVVVRTFVERANDLKSGKGRDESTRKADQAALEKLAVRGIGPDVLAHLQNLIGVATEGTKGVEPSPSPEDQAAIREAKIALRKRYVEWSNIAAALIKRRDWLLQLGLAKKKSKKTSKDQQDT